VVGDERWQDELNPDESLQTTGICGSGIIEIVAELFLAGIIDNSGRFVLDNPHPRLHVDGRKVEFTVVPAHETSTGQAIIVTQNDVRAIQLAKGALYAGIKLLMNKMGVTQVDRVKLAGAFGAYIDPQYAMILGLIPDCDLDQISAVGNAAGDGARIALLNTEQRLKAQEAVTTVDYVETAIAEEFQEEFVGAMGIPHATDSYPHLESILPERQSNNSRAERRSRRKDRKGV
jgi:uncharacterized 2Fe-2S/4Fe-4S cluster protein (DUF4445 family)